MTDKTVLIVYGSRYGSTEEISEKISNILENKGIKTELVDLRKTPNKEWPNLNHYDGILIGTGIKIGQWTKEVKSFVKKNKAYINSTKTPVGFYISSGFASFPERRDKVKEECVTTPLDNIGVTIPYLGVFGGVIDFSRMGWMDRSIAKLVAKSQFGMDSKVTRTDMRDWDMIHEFAEKFGITINS